MCQAYPYFTDKEIKAKLNKWLVSQQQVMVDILAQVCLILSAHIDYFTIRRQEGADKINWKSLWRRDLNVIEQQD